MPRKIDLITDLYKRTISDITSDSVAWRAFLHSAAYQYKYPFSDQVLIYAQRPRAIACAELELWNKHFGRWVNKGATGIALIDGRGAKHYLRYVFDVSDTHHRGNIPFDIWNIKPGYEADVIETLQNRFIVDDTIRDKISDAVIAASINLGSDNITDYLQELSHEKEGSYLEAFDGKNLHMCLQLTVQASVAYVVLTRLGYNADDYVGKELFEWVKEFNTPATVNILGTATSDISEICLREIERTVKSIELTVPKVNRTFDGNEKNRYNDGEKSETHIDNENGGITNDIDLQDRERSTASELGAAGADELPARKVRTDETGLHEGASQGDLHDDIDGWQAEPISARDRRSGEETNRGGYIEDGTEPWSDRADEADRPVEMGGTDEQHQKLGGGASVERSNISLEQSNAAISDSTLPAIADPENLIQILRHGDYLRHSKEEIVSFLSSDASETEKTEFVKKAYPPLQFSEFFKKGTEQHLGYRADDNGLLLYEGNFPSRTAETGMSWRLVTQLIGALIKDGNYLDESISREGITLERTPQAGKRKQVENQISFFDTNEGGTEYSNESSAVEKGIESEYNLNLGTTVYIGKDACEILSLSVEKVELFDGTLIPLEMDYDTFMKRVRENPLNDHLRNGYTEQVAEMPKLNIRIESKPKQSRKRKSNEPTIESVTSDLESDYARWDELLINGGSDPAWSDGVNMNLVQGRIVANRRRLLEMCGDGEKPAILDREEPPRMSNDYMARADEIREAAKKSLEIYKSNPTYQWCREQMNRIPGKMLKNSLIPNMLSYVTALEGYIEKGDLVGMRRHRDPNRCMDSFERCKQEIEKLLPEIEQEQMTDDLFNALMNNEMPINESIKYSEDVHIYVDTDI